MVPLLSPWRVSPRARWSEGQFRRPILGVRPPCDSSGPLRSWGRRPGPAAGARAWCKAASLLPHTRWRAGDLDAAGRGAARGDGEPGAVRAALQRRGPALSLQPHGPVPEEDEEACGQRGTRGSAGRRQHPSPHLPRVTSTQICPCPPPLNTGSWHRWDPRVT